MRVVNTEKLVELQKSPDKIRNICIIAHVDHGKTTLADSLVASNGIISSRMAGKLRYMDSRKDEQERGITMKSSSITLFHEFDGSDCLVNLIDSPGHVDFSSEVSTAVRLCDGAILVVDVVEGVCPQTQVALKQAWQENIKPVLVLNKIDRLILEIKSTPLDAFVHLNQVLEQINAITGELFATEVLEKNDGKVKNNENNQYDWGDGLEESDDSNLYFSPDQGNVVFTSALDGWGFSVMDFVKLYSSKLGLREDVLKKTLWGDYYYNSKTKRVMKGAQEKAKKPLFVQLVLENIWALYDTICIRQDKTKLSTMIAAIGVNLAPRDLRHTDPKVQLQAIFSQWLPLSRSVLDMVYNALPPANKLTEEKVEKLMCSNNQSIDYYPEETQALKKAFIECSSDENQPVIVFVSKMFPIDRKLLPRNKPAFITNEEMIARRERARLNHAERMARNAEKPEETPEEKTEESPVEEKPPLPDDEFIAFARVYSGVLKKGATLYVLGPKHDPAAALEQIQEEGDIPDNLTLKDLKGTHHATKAQINDIYLMMGRELTSIDEAHAGNVVGLGGLEDHILKSATLSSVIYCPSFSELNLMAVPILRVAVEPVKHSDLPALVKGLKLLNQADACVQVFVQESGEHVLVTAGEVHLERCIDDLKTRYAKVEVNVSEPIIPFRETVVPPPTFDMVNEAIQEDTQKKDDDSSDENRIVTIITPNKQSTIKILCTPLPPELTDYLEKNAQIIKIIDQNSDKNTDIEKQIENLKIGDRKFVSKKILNDISNFKEGLNDILKRSDGIWSSVFDSIWSFGPRRCGPNLLINSIPGYDRNIWKQINTTNKLYENDNSFVNGFQLASLAGPLCEEPMMGVAFVVKDWIVNEEIPNSGTYGPLSGQIMSAVKEGCRRSFQVQPQRLMAAMYTCNIQANAEVLGKMYAVLGKRHGRVLAGDMTQGSASFTVNAVLPVIESYSFAQEIRKQTSGMANPQLVFSHWEIIDIDPFWSPSTEEEYLHYGEKADTENKARQYMNSVRRRKGLPVEEKIVQHAEKQRTLHKKK